MPDFCSRHILLIKPVQFEPVFLYANVPGVVVGSLRVEFDAWRVSSDSKRVGDDAFGIYFDAQRVGGDAF